MPDAPGRPLRATERGGGPLPARARYCLPGTKSEGWELKQRRGPQMPPVPVRTRACPWACARPGLLCPGVGTVERLGPVAQARGSDDTTLCKVPMGERSGRPGQEDPELHSETPVVWYPLAPAVRRPGERGLEAPSGSSLSSPVYSLIHKPGGYRRSLNIDVSPPTAPPLTQLRNSSRTVLNYLFPYRISISLIKSYNV